MSFQVINGKIFFAIIHRSRIKHPFTLIIKESIRFCQNEFQFKIKILGLKIYKKKKNLLLMHEDPRLLIKQVTQTCRNQNRIKNKT
jgi:hypothetical protein